MHLPTPKAATFQMARPAKSGGGAHDATGKDAMRIAHVLRKYNPAEWGGTETALHRSLIGLRQFGVHSVVFCPRLEHQGAADPLAEAGCTIKRFHAFLPVLGLSPEERRQQVAVGGNLMSLDLARTLGRERGISIIHTHALKRLGGISSLVARRRNLPLVVTIHGGFLDLPDALRECFRKANRGWEWGQVFGLLLRSRRLFHDADAILTCNPREAALLSERFSRKRIIVQPHGVLMDLYRQDCRDVAYAAFPQLQRHELLLCVGRIDAVKNQRWLVEEIPVILQRHPQALLVCAGACTDEHYGTALRARIRELGLERHVLVTGGLPPDDARLIGLYQAARAVLLPSVSETFGLVILEAWAARTPVIASRTSGAVALIREGQNGWLFVHGVPQGFHAAVDEVLLKPELAGRFAAAGHQLVINEFDNVVLAGRMQQLYAQLIEEKHALRHFAG